MPMCKFGCDDLYEKGYITIFEGKIIEIERINQKTPYLDSYINDLLSRGCAYWNENSSKSTLNGI